MRASLPLHPCPIQSSLPSPAAPHIPSPLSDSCRVFGNPLTQLTTQLSSTHPPGSHLSVPSTVPKRCPQSLSNAGYYISPNGFSKVLHPFFEILYLQNLESILKKRFHKTCRKNPPAAPRFSIFAVHHSIRILRFFYTMQL